jgi:hypothetical protein
MLGFLFGEDRTPEPSRWLAEWNYRDDAPMIKLVDAILAQAVTDRATRIRFVVDAERHLIDLPTEEEWKKRQEIDEWFKKHGIPDRQEETEMLPIWVDFEFSGGWMSAMVCPGNLADGVVRRLKVRLNHERFTTLEEPENLIYIKDSFLRIDSYTPTEKVRAIVSIEPEIL